MISRIRGLHKNESGQSIVFSAITFLFLAMFVFMVLNVGDVTQRKMRLTNNADAVAVSGATWMCRGYNLTAMINVTMSQVLAIIILMKSFKRADELGQLACTVQEKVGQVLMEIPYTFAAGSLLYSLATAQYYVIDKFCKNVYEKAADELENNGNGILWDILDYMQDAEEITVKVIPFIAQAEAVKTGLANGATIGFLYPTIPLVDLKLPFIDDDDRKFESLCGPTATDFNRRSIPEHTKVKKIGEIGMDGQEDIEHMPTTEFLSLEKVSDWLGPFVRRATLGNFGPAPLEYFKAYLIYPLMRLLPPFVGAIYDAVVRATYMTMCTNQPGEYTCEKTTDNCEECKQHFDDITAISYKKNVALTIRKDVSKIEDIIESKDCNCGESENCIKLGSHFDENGNLVDDCKEFTVKVEGKDVWLKNKCKSEVIDKADDAKDFFDDKMHKKCTKEKEKTIKVFPEDYGLQIDDEPLDDNGRVKAKRFEKTVVTSCRYKTTEKLNKDEVWGSITSDDDKPKPYLLNREDDNGKEYWQTHKDYVGIVYELPKDNIVKIKAGLDNPNPVGVIYFSQAEIYVPDGVEPHLFNQCWQVRLVRFTKFKELSEKLNSEGVSEALNTAGSGNSGAIGKFMNLFKALKEIFNGDVIIH